MKKRIFIMFAIIITAVFLFATCASGASPQAQEASSNKMQEGDWFAYQFVQFVDAQHRGLVRSTHDIARSGGGGFDPYYGRSATPQVRPFGSQVSRPSWINTEAASEHDIDRAIQAYGEALRLLGGSPNPRATLGPRTVGSTGGNRQQSERDRLINVAQVRLREANEAKQEWSRERPR